jgi:hypothetical protein
MFTFVIHTSDMCYIYRTAIPKSKKNLSVGIETRTELHNQLRDGGGKRQILQYLKDDNTSKPANLTPLRMRSCHKVIFSMCIV